MYPEISRKQRQLYSKRENTKHHPANLNQAASGTKDAFSESCGGLPQTPAEPLRISSGAPKQVNPTLRPSRSEESLTERDQEEEFHYRVFRSQEHPEAPRQATTVTCVSQLMREFCHLPTQSVICRAIVGYLQGCTLLPSDIEPADLEEGRCMSILEMISHGILTHLHITLAKMEKPERTFGQPNN